MNRNNEATHELEPGKPVRSQTNYSSTLPEGIVIGTFAGFTESGLPLVDFIGNAAHEPVPARTTVELQQHEGGREVILVFERGDLARPLILGCLRPAATPVPKDGDTTGSRAVRLDGEQLNLTADREIILRCGKASITLTRAGKVLICGEYLLSRSSGANRIKGGSIHIN